MIALLAVFTGLILGIQRALLPTPLLSVMRPECSNTSIRFYLANLLFLILPDLMMISLVFSLGLCHELVAHLIILAGGLILFTRQIKQHRFHQITDYLTQKWKVAWYPFTNPNTLKKVLVDELCSVNLYLDSVVPVSFIYYAFYREKCFSDFSVYLLVSYFIFLSIFRLVIAFAKRGRSFYFFQKILQTMESFFDTILIFMALFLLFFGSWYLVLS